MRIGQTSIWRSHKTKIWGTFWKNWKILPHAISDIFLSFNCVFGVFANKKEGVFALGVFFIGICTPCSSRTFSLFFLMMTGWSITMSSIVSIDLIHAIARRQHWCGGSGEADIGGVVRVPPLVSGAAIWSVAYDGIPQPRRRWQLSFWRFEPLIFNFFTDTAQLIGNFTISWDLNFHGPAQSVSFSRFQMSAWCVSPQIFHGQKARLSRVEAVCGRHLSSCAVSVCFFYFFNSCAFLQVFRGFFSLSRICNAFWCMHCLYWA